MGNRRLPVFDCLISKMTSPRLGRQFVSKETLDLEGTQTGHREETSTRDAKRVERARGSRRTGRSGSDRGEGEEDRDKQIASTRETRPE